MKVFFKKNIALLLGLLFIFVTLLFGFVMLKDNINYSNILKNGIETDGYILPESYYSNTIVNNVKYYEIGYYFYDEQSNKHEGTTSATYTYSEILEFSEMETIKIKYDPKTFDSVESSFNLYGTYTKNSIFVLGIFVFFSVLSFVWGIIIGIKEISLVKVKRDGKEYPALVVAKTSGVVVNGVPQYRIVYTWKDELGNNITSKTRCIYTYYEALALEELGKITIKAIGKRSFVTTIPDVSRFYAEGQDTTVSYDENREKSVIEKRFEAKMLKGKSSKCEFCGQKVNSTYEYCDNCGARINNKKTKSD